MFSIYSKLAYYDRIRKSVAFLLIAGMLFFGSPGFLVFAEESGGGESTPASAEGGGGDDGADGESGASADSAEAGGSDGAPGEEGSAGEGDGSGNAGSEGDGGSGAGEGDGGDANIETGDSVAVSDTENEANTTIVNTDEDGGSEEGNGENGDENTDGETVVEENHEEAEGESTGTTTPEIATTLGGNGTTTPQTGTSTVPANITASTTAEAELSNTSSGEADTGGNHATSTEGTANIKTGDALASANVINVVNTSIVNSTGFLLLLNQLFGGTLDLRAFNFFAPSAPVSSTENGAPCSLSGCGQAGTSITISNNSTAIITNDVIVRSSTGGNSASGDGASITTGNAYASANVINVANTSLVNSNYLLISLNNFGDMAGDIVFPGLDFFTQFFSKGSGLSITGNTNISTMHDADVENTVGVTAKSGDNMATSTEGGSALVETGDASANGNVVNQVNTSLFGIDSFYVLLRVHGDWSGSVFGLPDGISWAETPFGIELYNSDALSSGSGSALSSLDVASTSTAKIKNNVSVMALTGDNKVEGGAGGASITTGDAVAGANVVNIVNSSVVGRNWILAIFNIFGDWNGNISFGRPDLWIGGRVESPHEPMREGSPVTYRFTITNFGDADATDVHLKGIFDDRFISFASGGSELTDALWNLGRIPKGSTVEVSYEALIAPGGFAYGETPIPARFTVTSAENDDNPEDNTEEIAIVAIKEAPKTVSSRTGIGGSGPRGGGFPYADLEITKRVLTEGPITASSTVDYEVVINNWGRSAYDAGLHDVIRDSEGDVVSEQVWELGEIFPDEEITITYTVFFNGDAEPGLYTNTARVLAIDDRSIWSPLHENAHSDSVTAEIEIVERTPLRSEGLSCGMYLQHYVGAHTDTPAGVIEKLQEFLRTLGGFESVAVTGVYDTATKNAVTRFQSEYAPDILTPWGLSEPTGYVYYTTQKKINELYCDNQKEFPLSNDQLSEINSFKTRLDRIRDRGEALPDTSVVGQADPDESAEEEVEETRTFVQEVAQRATAGAAGAFDRQPKASFFGSLMNSIREIMSRVTTGADITLDRK